MIQPQWMAKCRMALTMNTTLDQVWMRSHAVRVKMNIGSGFNPPWLSPTSRKYTPEMALTRKESAVVVLRARLYFPRALSKVDPPRRLLTTRLVIFLTHFQWKIM